MVYTELLTESFKYTYIVRVNFTMTCDIYILELLLYKGLKKLINCPSHS